MANVFFPTLAHAGPHDLTGAGGMLHVLTSAEHMAVVGFAIAAGYVGYALYRRASSTIRLKTATRAKR